MKPGYRPILLLLLSIAGAPVWGIAASLSIGNEKICRTFSTEQGFHTSSYRYAPSGTDYVRTPQSAEFSFSINGEQVIGNRDFQYRTHRNETNRFGGTLLFVQLQGKNGTPAQGVDVTARYETFPGVAVIRKELKIDNRRDTTIALTDLNVEQLFISMSRTWLTDAVIYSNYGTKFNTVPYLGDYHDAAVMVYNKAIAGGCKEGFIAGNEAPGVLKRTSVYQHDEELRIGMNPAGDPFPFKYNLAAGHSFTTPGTFLCMFAAENYQDGFEQDYASFMRHYFGVKLFEQPHTPFLIYNTWQPFMYDINEKLICELADALEGTGTDLFIIDDGWQNESGRWQVDQKKFPRGLRYLCDYIRSKGMEPGLWFAFGNVKANSHLVKQHPQWLIKDAAGNPTNLHSYNAKDLTMSMGSGWFDYMLNIIRQYVRECNLRYLKLDLTVVTSAYMLDYARTGDFGFEGKCYSDHASSYYALYQRTLDFMDSLTTEFPNLLLDCTYETMGRYGLIDFSTLKHAHYDWLTNYEAAPPVGPLSIRQMARDRARTIPPATCLIGNQYLVGNMSEYTFLSVASSLPILLGDVRKITPAQKVWYGRLTGWFKEMQHKYQIDRFYTTSDLFDRPGMSNWDGVYKFNAEKGGGVLFFYRNGSLTSTQRYPIRGVNPAEQYRLYSAISGKQYGVFTGSALLSEGISITLPEMFSAEVIGIERVAQ